MVTTMKADPANREGQLLYRALLPLFLVAEGARRILTHFRSNDPDRASTRRNWLDEARSQTCVAMSYALMARSMLQSSERRYRAERPS